MRGSYDVDGIASEADLDVMLRHLGVAVLTSSDIPPPLRDLYAGGRVALRRGQGREWEKWIKAHVIGHRLLHTGNQLDAPLSWVRYQERQADEFAGWLIWGDLRESLDDPPYPITTRLVASEARVPEGCVERWWQIVGSGLREAG